MKQPNDSERGRKCGYCWGGYCANQDVRGVQLRTAIGGKWDAEKTTAGTKCREYLKGHFKFVKEKKKGEFSL